MARYKGRHRAPTSTGKRLAALGAAAVVPGTFFAVQGEALAGPPNGWGPIISCESGGNPTVKNAHSTASGLFQFINGTWAAYGGLEFAPTARQATVEQQYIVAERAYAREGTTPWNASKSCWAGKTGEATIKASAPAASANLKVEVTKKKAEAVVEQTQLLPVVVPQGQFTPGGTGTYEVKAGDTLTFIARDYSTTVDELVEANKDIVEHRDWIYVGEKLNLPANDVQSPEPQ